MKHLTLTAIAAAALLSAPACTAETPKEDKKVAAPAPAETSQSASKFNFNVPGEDYSSSAPSDGYNFTVPNEDGQSPAKGGLGGVELPDDGVEELPGYEPSLNVPTEG